MDTHPLERYLASRDPNRDQTLLDDESAVFWVDWRSDDAEIAEACEAILRTGRLRSTPDDEGLVIVFGERRQRVPLTWSAQDRHITLLTLNRVLAPDHEVRLVGASDGSDTLGFAPLPIAEWQRLATRFGAEILDAAFPPLRDDRNVFTDPPGRAGRQPASQERAPAPKRPWWRFW